MKWLQLVYIVVLVPLAFSFDAAAQGRYIGAHGVPPGHLSPGSHEAKLDFEPYSATYLPMKKGELVTGTDDVLADQLTNGFVAGRCDIVSDTVKNNATLPSADKYDRAVENTSGFNPNLYEYYEGTDDLADQHDKLQALRKEFYGAQRELAELDRNRGSLGFGEYLAKLVELRTRLLDAKAKYQQSKRTYVPSFGDFLRVLYFEGGLPSSFADPNNYGRWRGYRPEAAGWEGFCHNWAPAGLDPTARLVIATDRIFGEVPFGVGDLRELTTYLRPEDDEKWFGKRNWGDGRYDPAHDDFTPVDVHALLTHYVGPGKPGLVFDVDPGSQVWNQPVYRYEYQAHETSSRPAGLTTVAGGKVYAVGMTFDYANEANDYASRGPTRVGSESLNYLLSTDAHGNIVDGKWVGSNRIPDFATVHENNGSSAAFDRLKDVSSQGVAVSQIENVCQTLWTLPRNIRKRHAILRGLKPALTEIAPVVDARRFNNYLRTVARERRIDYSNLQRVVGI